MTSPELPDHYEAPDRETVELMGFLRETLDTFGELGSTIGAAPNVVSSAGFLDYRPNSQTWPTNLVVVTEYIDPHDLDMKYQVGTVGHVSPKRIETVDRSMGSRDAGSLQDWLNEFVTPENFARYNDPANTTIVDDVWNQRLRGQTASSPRPIIIRPPTPDEQLDGKMNRKERKRLVARLMEQGYNSDEAYMITRITERAIKH